MNLDPHMFARTDIIGKKPQVMNEEAKWTQSKCVYRERNEKRQLPQFCFFGAVINFIKLLLGQLDRKLNGKIDEF